MYDTITEPLTPFPLIQESPGARAERVNRYELDRLAKILLIGLRIDGPGSFAGCDAIKHGKL